MENDTLYEAFGEHSGGGAAFPLGGGWSVPNRFLCGIENGDEHVGEHFFSCAGFCLIAWGSLPKTLLSRS
jgi:hypothetical protein